MVKRDDTTRSIIRNVKGAGEWAFSFFVCSSYSFSPSPAVMGMGRSFDVWILGCVARRLLIGGWFAVREDDILCLLESEREARRLR